MHQGTRPIAGGLLHSSPPGRVSQDFECIDDSDGPGLGVALGLMFVGAFGASVYWVVGLLVLG